MGGFFSIDLTTASLKLSGKRPDFNEMLTILTINGTISSMHFLSSHVGVGSISQDLLVLFMMIVRISSDVA